jgi:heme-degrading monooxygenase HmoA
MEALMAIRVIIEREIEPGNEIKFLQILIQLRGRAIQEKGYISGETLRALDDPNKYIIVSTWNNVEDWKSWENSPKRKEIEKELDRFLRGQSKSNIYIYI